MSIVTAPLAGTGGAVTAAVAVVRDITRLHQLEAEMHRGETLAAAGQILLTRFAFNEARMSGGREDIRTNPVTFEAEATW